MEPAVHWISTHVVHNGTHAAYVNLIEGRTDLILVARAPSPDEVQLAEVADVTLDVRPVAVDAFVFLLHQDNLLEGLTLDQIRAIYAGQIANWQEVGGVDAKINAYQRNPNSGSQELMLSLVMQGMEMASSPPEMIGMSMTGPYNQMHSDSHGIAYSIYYYKEQMAPKTNVKLCAVDGVAPTREHIFDRTYPLSSEVYAVVRSDLPDGSSARVLLNWLLSAEGQAVVDESGYVPVR
jgi:phosphate transport system substrate-binding protein